MPTLSLVVNKHTTFRGVNEVFSNRYLFQTGTNAIDHAFVQSVYNQVRDMEREFHGQAIKFVGGWGGELGLDAVFSHTESPVLQGNLVSGTHTHPEVCLMAESKVANKIYLRKFYHARLGMPTSGGDAIDAAVRGTMETQVLKLTNGTLPGGIKACRPNGALATVPFTGDGYLRTRQFKRRGRRPTAASG